MLPGIVVTANLSHAATSRACSRPEGSRRRTVRASRSQPQYQHPPPVCLEGARSHDHHYDKTEHVPRRDGDAAASPVARRSRSRRPNG